MYFPKPINLAIEIDENNHSGYDKKEEVKREKYLKKQLGCEIMRINPDDDEFDIFKDLGLIFE